MGGMIAPHINAQMYRHLFFSIYCRGFAGRARASHAHLHSRACPPARPPLVPTVTHAPAPLHVTPAATPWWKGLLAPAVNPRVFDFWAQRLNPVWSWSQPLARVVARRAENPDTVTLTLAPNRHVGGFQPGQHINLSAEVQGRRVTRSYSLTGVPRADRLLTITVQRVPGGVLSNHLVERTRVGDVLGLGPAFGNLVLPRQPQGAWLFLAAGSGITPLMGLTRSLAAQGMPCALTLLYWVRHRDALCFRQELDALATRHPGFRWQPIVTDEAPRPGEAHGLIHAEQLASLVPDLSSRQAMACGPGGFVTAAQALVQPLARSFQAEGFTPPPISAPSAGSDPARTVQVTLQRSGRILDVCTHTPLLEALEAHGLNPPSGCRMGICHSCSCTRLSGSTREARVPATPALEDSEAGRAVRLCVSHACCDLTLDL